MSLMSSSFEQSYVCGIPSKCGCGLDVSMITSKTQENPGRPFFRCISKRDVSLRSNKRDNHTFKWVENVVVEEDRNGRYEFEVIKMLIHQLKEDGEESKRKIEKLKVWTKFALLCFFLMTIAIVYSFFLKSDVKLVVG